MNLLITGVDQPLGALAAAHFRGEHCVRSVATRVAPDGTSTAVDLGNPEVVAPLVDGVGAVLHLSPFDPSTAASEKDRLDQAARGTYVLMSESRKAGVDRVILASTLGLMAGYPEENVVEASWQPQPAPRAEALAPYLCEIVGREFAREGGIRTVCLRFGTLGPDTSQEDALRALEGALVLPFKETGYRWQLFHVATQGRFKLLPTPLGFDKEVN